MEDTKIHLVKASFLAQFKEAMESCGASPEKYLKKVKLPAQITDAESLLPVRPFYQLINMFAIEEHVPNFGSIVAQTTPWHKVASLGPLIKKSQNLRILLERFCQVSNGQSSSTNFTFVETESESRFCYINTLDYHGDVQMEFYRITSMIQLVQLASGACWRPNTIHLMMPENTLTSYCTLLNSSEIIFSQPVSSISIPLDQLALPVHIDIPGRVSTETVRQAHRHIEYVESVRQIINSYSLTGGITIEDLAHITDQSIRTVQRRLKSAGLSFNQIVNEARYLHASDKLLNSDLSLSEIARLLGYSDPAHFSRAFRRWSGLSPSAFAKQK